MEKKRVYIAGLGLIGASLALGIKRDHPRLKFLAITAVRNHARLPWNVEW